MSDPSYQLAPAALPATPSARSQRTFTSTERDFDSELGIDDVPGASGARGGGGDAGGQISSGSKMVTREDEGMDEAVHFCLLAEFDIDAGATLADQYPHPTGTDEQSVLLPVFCHNVTLGSSGERLMRVISIVAWQN